MLYRGPTAKMTTNADHATEVRRFFESMTPIPDEEWAYAERFIGYRSFDKGAHLLREGDTARHSFLILRGIVRVYYLTAEGKEFNKSFAMEHNAVGSGSSIIAKLPSRFSIQALEPTLAALLPREAIEELYDRHRCWDGRLSGLGLRRRDPDGAHRTAPARIPGTQPRAGNDRRAHANARRLHADSQHCRSSCDVGAPILESDRLAHRHPLHKWVGARSAAFRAGLSTRRSLPLESPAPAGARNRRLTSRPGPPRHGRARQTDDGCRCEYQSKPPVRAGDGRRCRAEESRSRAARCSRS